MSRTSWRFCGGIETPPPSPIVRRSIFALTFLAIVVQSLPNVPRAAFDFSTRPLLRWIPQHETFGTDTIADMYEAKVVLHDPLDMYTKRGVEQTPLEAVTWSKPASAPYPPAMLLTEAALFWVGQQVGIGFYGMILLLAIVFLVMSASYFARTRWYLFPLLYLNFSYLGYRFVYVQDCSYLIVLVVVTGALWRARARNGLAHYLMALAIDMKITALYYVSNVFSLKRRTAVLFLVVLAAGLALPFLIWENYLYIVQFNDAIKAPRFGLASAIISAIPFAVVLWYIERTLRFDLEDRVGWAMVPCAMFLAIKMNVPRHLLMALLIPDKRGWRNVIAAVSLGLNAAFPTVVRLGALLPIATVLLMLVLIGYLRRIGWSKVRADFAHPLRTFWGLAKSH